MGEWGRAYDMGRRAGLLDASRIVRDLVQEYPDHFPILCEVMKRIHIEFDNSAKISEGSRDGE